MKRVEKRVINLLGEPHDFVLRRPPRTRYLRLRISADGSLVVAAPRSYPIFLINQFISSRAQWIVTNIKKVKDRHSLLSTRHSSSEIKKYKVATKELLADRLEYFNKFYNFSFKRIAIRNQRSRWGSCSSKGNLNFNYRLCLLPSDLADYIIVHELCHLGQMNHSKQFWQLVAKTIPDYKVSKQKLLRI